MQQRLVLSAMAALKERRKQRLKELVVGETIIGKVSNLVPFGAFANLGDIDGLIHISKLAWEKVKHPSEVLQVGEEVEVLIEDIDLDRERVRLNRRALLPSPVEEYAERHEEGDLAEGVVSNIRDFGAFVVLAPGVVGLLHVSEMMFHGDRSPHSVLQKGDQVLVRIINMQPERNRISLSTRQVTYQEQLAWLKDTSEQLNVRISIEEETTLPSSNENTEERSTDGRPGERSETAQEETTSEETA